MGYPITIESATSDSCIGQAEILINGKTDLFDSGSIEVMNGETFIITLSGCSFSGSQINDEIKISYINSETGTEHIALGEITSGLS